MSQLLKFAYEELPSTVDPDRPLIYLWQIWDAHGRLVTCYVGEASGDARRPRRAYANNVRRLRMGLGWHGGSLESYRDIHRAMSMAVDSGQRVTLTLLCNLEPGEDINEAERRERGKYGCPGR